nr:RNA-dependent RNA polymerase [Flumine sobemo-like virus 16]
MPLSYVGESHCKFREVGRKPVSADCSQARDHFPELRDLDWPDRGSQAEFKSLMFQAGRSIKTNAPENLGEEISRLEARYPKIQSRPCLRGSQWSHEECEAEIKKIAKCEINRKASPGVPLAAYGKTNAEVLDHHLDLVVHLTVSRLFALRDQVIIGKPNPVDLVSRGLVDPVRLFVKQEPHPMKKIKDNRFRLISSVSLIDQIIERMIFGPQNKLEICLWDRIPSKPGMGMTLDKQCRSLWTDLAMSHSRVPAAEADISGFDWSVQDWELWADLAIRISLGSFDDDLIKVAVNRWTCFMNSVFQLSDGTLISQDAPGLMKSGSYCTSSTNSRIRCLMAYIIGSDWCIAMGDDSVDGYEANAREKYALLGHVCKDYVPCAADYDTLLEVNFCSHVLRSERHWLVSWPKTLFKYLHANRDDIDDLEMELKSSPNWDRIRKYCLLLRGGDKDVDQEAPNHERIEDSLSGNATSCPKTNWQGGLCAKKETTSIQFEPGSDCYRESTGEFWNYCSQINPEVQWNFGENCF